MRTVILHVAVACIIFGSSTQLTKLWNRRSSAALPRQTVQSVAAGSDRSISADEPELLRIYNEYAAAQTRHDREFFERVEADDFKLFADGRSYSRTEDIGLMNSSPADIVYKTDDLKIEIQGNVAVVTGRMTATHSSGYSDSWSWVDVCAKRGHGWQILSTTQSD